jgi:hypothetical protein
MAGHAVAFACADFFRPDIEAVGFTTFPMGLDWRTDTMTQTFPTSHRLPAALTLGYSALA